MTESGTDNAQDAIPGHRWAIGLLVIVLVVWGAVMWVVIRTADLPDETAGTVLVVFRPDMPRNERLMTIARADGRVIAETGLPSTWLVHSERAGFAGRLRAAGALSVFRETDLTTINLSGCFGGAPNLSRLFRDDSASSDR